MTKAGLILRALVGDIEAVNPLTAETSPIDRILQKISTLDLPDRGHFESYMRYKRRMNHKASTLKGSCHAVSSFLIFYAGMGKSHLQEIISDDLESFVEHEQDRGLKVTTVRTRLNHLWAFLHPLLLCIVFYPLLNAANRYRLPSQRSLLYQEHAFLSSTQTLCR